MNHSYNYFNIFSVHLSVRPVLPSVNNKQT